MVDLQGAMDMLQDSSTVEVGVKIMNLILFLFYPRRFLNARWGDILSDSTWNAFDFARNQFYRVYLRFSTKYRYHPQQMKYNAARNIDPVDNLAQRMKAHGTAEYYKALMSSNNEPRASDPADLSTHKECESLRDIVDRISRLAVASCGGVADFATELVINGLTREIAVDDGEDWQLLRLQLRHMTPDVTLSPESITHDVFPFAVSYKAKEETFVSNVTLHHRGQEPDDEMKEEVEMTQKLIRSSDFLDDRRWEQLQRAVQAYARSKGYLKVSLWVDRLMKLGQSPEKIIKRYSELNWVDYGLYPYMLMPTVRVYDPSETLFGTTFWRKVEATLAISGKGLVCDDYVMRKYDRSIYFDSSQHQRLSSGIIVIGGKTIYVRSTVLALATMIVTDGISITTSNEHPNTRSSIVQWKSWAMRCILQQAFSNGPAIPICNDPIYLDMNGFKLLTSWEYDLCYNKELKGGSYIDMTYERSMRWSKAAAWSGISEWVGMMGSAFFMEETSRDEIMQYLSRNTTINMYAAPSGHTAALLDLKNGTGNVIKSLVVDTARFSTATHGYVVAVADATGHGGKRVMPWYLKQVPDPDEDQKVSIVQGELAYEYKAMKVALAVPAWLSLTLLIILNVVLVFATFGIWILILVPYLLWKMTWPWADYDDVGEALFDNLLVHSLYGSGIKQIYRKIITADYGSLNWK